MIQGRLKLGIKAVIRVIMLLFIFLGCAEKQTNFFATIELKEGLPEVLKPLEKDLPFKDISYAALDTGSDTLQIFFGTLSQGTRKGHWIGLESKGQPAHFSSVNLEKVDTLDYLSKDIEIEFNEDSNLVALRVIEVDSVNFKYAWLDNSELSGNIAIKSLEKPLRINSKFPGMILESIGGEHFTSRDFKDQFVVINWWATWCAPCIKEIPGLNEMVDKYSQMENVRFIAITDDPKNRITSFLKTRDFNYEITFGNSEVRNLFGNSYPVNIIINPTGIITYHHSGASPQTPAEIESSLSQQLERYNSREVAETK